MCECWLLTFLFLYTIFCNINANFIICYTLATSSCVQCIENNEQHVGFLNAFRGNKQKRSFFFFISGKDFSHFICLEEVILKMYLCLVFNAFSALKLMANLKASVKHFFFLKIGYKNRWPDCCVSWNLEKCIASFYQAFLQKMESCRYRRSQMEGIKRFTCALSVSLVTL